jgi:hypothetical protein
MGLLVLVDARNFGLQSQAVGMCEDPHLRRITDPIVKVVIHEFRATLQDANEGQTPVVVGLGEDFVEQVGDPVDSLGHEGNVCHPKGDRQRIERVEGGAKWRGVAFQPAWRGWRGLVLGQAIDLIVVQQHGHVHVVADRMQPVRGTDAATIAVAGGDKDMQVGAADLDAFGDRQGAAMGAVEPIGVHVMRQPRRTADPGNADGLFGWQLFVPAQFLHGGQDGVVAAPGAPARRDPALIVGQFIVGLHHLHQALAHRSCHR